MKTLLLTAATIVISSILLACSDGHKSVVSQGSVTTESANPTATVVAVSSSTPASIDTDAQLEACHYQNGDKGTQIIYEDSQICIFLSNGYYIGGIPFAKTIGEYRELKVITEQKIYQFIPNLACKVIWAPPLDVKSFLVRLDLITTGCDGT